MAVTYNGIIVPKACQQLMEDEIKRLSLESVDKKAGTLFQGHMQQINEIFESKKIVCFEIKKPYSFILCRTST